MPAPCREILIADCYGKDYKAAGGGGEEEEEKERPPKAHAGRVWVQLCSECHVNPCPGRAAGPYIGIHGNTGQPTWVQAADPPRLWCGPRNPWGFPTLFVEV